MDKLQKLIHERPSFHQGETEISRTFEPEESLLSRDDATRLRAAEFTCYGIGADVLQYIADSINEGSRTLETGAGCSTLIFALKGAAHIAVTPSESEGRLIRQYAQEHGIPTDKLTFAHHSSDQYLPTCEASGLDMVLLDGKHAFPWPIVDWFYTADRLRTGGLMVIDDAHMRSVSVLVEFLSVDPGWSLVRDFSGRTIVFRKLRDLVHDVAWHMQPYTMQTAAVETENPRRLLRRMFRGLRRGRRDSI